ncbi:MAG: hypothetical protein JWP32_2427, partial [Schumannella sp.]|nr:hypothetical protein [Schumannella sp.]
FAAIQTHLEFIKAETLATTLTPREAEGDMTIDLERA